MPSPSATKTIAEINERIRHGEATVVTAEEMPSIVGESGPRKAAEEVDVVTTGTFGAMCSSGAWLNFGHSDPPIKMRRVWLNDVEAYTGVAAVDVFIGATQISETRGLDYGGGHVIEDLVRGKEVTMRAEAYGTDCYPRTNIEIDVGLQDLNQAIMLNPRNCYQRYNAATNGRDETIYTYMGALLAGRRNVTFSGAGCLNPLCNDPEYRTLGLGTRISLGGAQGYIIGEGTQHSPQTGFGTLMVRGDLKAMSPEYVRGATFQRYGTTLYVGIGAAIPILDEDLARATAITDEQIDTKVLDYGVPRRDRPTVKETNYAELRSGQITIDGRDVPVSPLSSFKMARSIAGELKSWIEKGEFLLTKPVETLPKKTVFKPMKARTPVPFVEDIATGKFTVGSAGMSINEAAKRLTSEGVDGLIIQGEDGALEGIVTSWDIAKALGSGAQEVGEVMTRKVIVAHKGEPIDSAARKLEKHGISAMPIIDAKRRTIGIISDEDIARFVGRRRW